MMIPAQLHTPTTRHNTERIPFLGAAQPSARERIPQSRPLFGICVEACALVLPSLVLVAGCRAGPIVDSVDEERQAVQRAAFAEPLASPQTPRLEHSWIPADSAERVPIRVERTPLITPDTERPETLFYRVGGIAADEENNVYVLDLGTPAIRVFDATGAYLRSIGGGRGQGPGQLGQGGNIAAGEDSLYYVSGSDRRIVIWDLRGKEISTRNMQHQVHEIEAADDGQLIASWQSRATFPYSYQVGNLWNGGGVAPLIGLARYPPRVVFRGTRGHALNEIPTPGNAFAVGRNRLYVVHSDRYEVLSFDLETRKQAWVLAVNHPPLEFGSADRQEVLVSEREDVPDLREDEIDWPTHQPSLSMPWPIRVDGIGRLFVFPFTRQRDPGVEYPVDVYDSEGNRIVAGLMPFIAWVTARGDYIYGLETNEADELIVVRYRIVS